MNYIDFKGLNSYWDMNLVIERFPSIPIPKRVIREIPVPGRDGVLTYDEGNYEDVIIPIEFGFITEDVIESSVSLNSWLDGTGGDLILSINTNYKYKVKKVTVNNFEEAVNTLEIFNASFLCEPFKYLKSGDTAIIVDKPIKQFNLGTYIAKPIIKVFGQGDVTISINNQFVVLKGIEDYIIMDSDVEETYKDNKKQNNKKIGKFLILEKGENTISWTGNVSKLEIVPRWRCL